MSGVVTTERKASKAKQQTPDLGAATAAWTRGPSTEIFRILLLAKMLDRLNTRILQESAGLSLAEWRMMGQLMIESPASVRQLAEWSWVDRAEVSRAAASLEARGFVERQENPRDRRSPLFFFTAEGKKVAEQVLPLRRAFLSSLTAKLSKAQREALEEALLVIAEACAGKLNDSDNSAANES
ncbi:MAG: MarR family winged helix-turn-helix transcriptional regulator [Caulobacteraceae bacterium]